MTLGEIYAITASATWAMSSVLVRTQTDRAGVLVINLVRCLAAELVLVALLPLVGTPGMFEGLPWRSVAFLIAAMILGLILGDSLFFKSLGLIGVARAAPITNTAPLFTFLLSLAFLEESLTWGIFLGSLLIVSGVTLIAVSRERLGGAARGKVLWEGIGLATVASVCWAVGTLVLKVAVADLNPYTAHVLRLAAAVLILGALRGKELVRLRRYGARSLGTMALAGVVGIGGSGLLYLSAVKYAGAARTASLAGTMPLFAALLSWLVLKERITLRVIAGSTVTVVGIWLVVG